ncbi:MAG: Mut7-C RNAse domain-containing protein [Bacteroidota bacterium]
MQITIRFYEELNDFLPVKKRKKSFSYDVQLNSSVKDTIEALGVPHTEVDLILVNSKPVDFTYNLHQGDYVSVYPKFESLDISQITKVRKEPLRKIKFILDVHLGQLAKYLRLLGFDTYYTNHLNDSEIIERSISEDRIILTRDFGILKHKKVTHGYYVRSQNSKTQLKEIIQRFDLKNKIKPFSRCSVCNGIINKIDKKEIEQRLLENTRTHFKQFYQCNSCKKIYWEGSHFENMNRLMDEIINQ